MVKLSFQDSPTKREATAHPPNFPTTATVINNRHTHHNSGVLINPICVRNPVKAKNNGRKKPMLYPQPSPSLPYGNQN